MTIDQITHMKSNRPQLYALWCRLERHKWDSAWWRFTFALKNYLHFKRRVERCHPHDLMYHFAGMWWEIGMVAKYYPSLQVSNFN